MSHRPDVRDDGFATAGFVGTVALSLLMFTLFANVIVVQYQRAALRAAADEGVRAGAVSLSDHDAVWECERRARAAVRDLLGGGRQGWEWAVSCQVPDAGQIRASVSGMSVAWLPAVPDFALHETSFALREAA